MLQQLPPQADGGGSDAAIEVDLPLGDGAQVTTGEQ
jgi:hypothetical protein